MMIAQFVFFQEFQRSATYNFSSQPCLGYLRFWEALFVFHLHLVLSSSSSLQFKTVIIINMSIHWRVHWAFQKVVLLFFVCWKQVSWHKSSVAEAQKYHAIVCTLEASQRLLALQCRSIVAYISSVFFWCWRQRLELLRLPLPEAPGQKGSYFKPSFFFHHPVVF